MTSLRRTLTLPLSLMVAVVTASHLHATCGGGGGGGRGGAVPQMSIPMPSSGGSGGGGGFFQPESRSDPYTVPWEFAQPETKFWGTDESSLMVVWLVKDATAVFQSDLLKSRKLVQFSERCVTFVLAPSSVKQPFARYHVDPSTETVILANPDGSEIARITGSGKGLIGRAAVEKLLSDETARREQEIVTTMKTAEEKAKAGDKAAINDYQKVWNARCLFPSAAKKAGKALKKLGAEPDEAALIKLGEDSLADSDIAGGPRRGRGPARSGCSRRGRRIVPNRRGLLQAGVRARRRRRDGAALPR